MQQEIYATTQLTEGAYIQKGDNGAGAGTYGGGGQGGYAIKNTTGGNEFGGSKLVSLGEDGEDGITVIRFKYKEDIDLQTIITRLEERLKDLE